MRTKDKSLKIHPKPEYILHISVFVDEGAIIGKDTKIWHNSHITNTAVIGEDCSIGQNCYIAGTIGKGCRIQNNVNVYAGVTLGDFVFCGPNMTFTNDKNPRAKYPKHGVWLQTKVCDGVSFGAGSIILSGITIGKWAFIGAGSVVTKDVPDYAIFVGNPGKLMGWMCECGEKMPAYFFLYTCNQCKKTYNLINNIVLPAKTS